MKQPRKILLIPTLLSGWSLILLFALTVQAQPPDMERLERQGHIVVAVLAGEAPPFFMQDKQGKLFGLDIELAENLAEQLGLTIEYNREARTYDDVVRVISEGKADIAISNLSRTLKRSKIVRFTEPYIILYQTVLFNRLKAAQDRILVDPRKFLNQPHIKISTLANSSYMDFARECFPLATVVPYADSNLAVQDVLDGRIHAFIFDNIFTKNWHYNNPNTALFLQTLVMKENEDQIAFAVNWKDTHLLAWLELYLKNIKTNGFLQRLDEKYMEGDTWREQWQPLTRNP